MYQLWFAWKFVPLWYQQQPSCILYCLTRCCDLLENSYLCGISNNLLSDKTLLSHVVICLKIRTFVVSATTLWYVRNCCSWLWFAWKFVPLWYQQQLVLASILSMLRCDLLENSYLCGISNNGVPAVSKRGNVVICLKIRTFVVSATTLQWLIQNIKALWFAWKFVPLWYQQQPAFTSAGPTACCDLLENSYLCGISNNQK